MFDSNNKSVTLLRTLTVAQLIFLGLAYMQPLVVLDTFGIVSQITNGHVAGAYVITTACLIFTALSYGKLSNKYPSSGSAYTYVQKVIGPKTGFMVGWSSLVDYLLMPLVNIIQAKAYLTAIFPAVDPWIFVVFLTFAITFFNIIGIKFVANINTWIVALQLFILAVFVLLMMDFIWSNPVLRPEAVAMHQNWTNPNLSPEAMATVSPFISEQLNIFPLFAGAALLCFSFLGFDSLSTFSEEAENPETTVPRGIILTVIVAGLMFVTISFFTQIIFPANFPFSNPEDSSQPDIILYVAGRFFQAVMLVFATFSVFAGGLVAQTGVSRLMYVMGRDEFFPKKFFGYVHPKFRTPVFNVLLVGLICLSAVYLTLEIIASVISFGALMAFTFVNLSVIIQFYYKDKRRTGIYNLFHFLIFPTIGALSIIALWFSLDSTAWMFGFGWVVFGIVYLATQTYIFNKSVPTDEQDDLADVLAETFETLDDAIEEAQEEIFDLESLEETYAIEEVIEEIQKVEEDNKAQAEIRQALEDDNS